MCLIQEEFIVLSAIDVREEFDRYEYIISF